MPINETLNAIIVLSLLSVVTLCAVTDILDNLIPNIVLLPALLLAFVCNSLMAGLPGFTDCLLGSILGMAVLFPFYLTGGTSAGDVKLLGVVGAFLGVDGALAAGLATLVFGGAIGILFITWRLIKPMLMMYTARLVRFGGAMGPSLLPTSTAAGSSDTYFPYAPAILCGTYYSLWHLGYLSQVTV